jgi:hypothetical protein
MKRSSFSYAGMCCDQCKLATPGFNIWTSDEEFTSALRSYARAYACYVTCRWEKGFINGGATSECFFVTSVVYQLASAYCFVSVFVNYVVDYYDLVTLCGHCDVLLTNPEALY